MMRAADCDILMVPGWSGSGPDHWQTRWEAKLATARRVEQEDWYKVDKDSWVARLHLALDSTTRPVVLVGHSCGVTMIAHAGASLDGRVKGAFLVAPASEAATRAIPGMDPAFVSLPTGPLPCPAMLVASRTDPYCPFSQAAAIARIVDAELVDAGDAGHLNTASGHGPWPEGLLRFGAFLRTL